MTVDALARRVGTTTRNVRLYQTRGLLPPPMRRGRVAYYDDRHVARLRLIARLQERGFSLAAIAELLEAWGRKSTVADVLGLEELVAAPWSDELPELLTREELARRFPAVEPELLERALGIGVLVPEGDKVRIPMPRLLAIGEELLAAGVAPSAALDELEKARDRLEEIADGFVALFLREVWQPFVAAGMPAERLRLITRTVERLRPLATEVVQLILLQALDRASGNATAEVMRLAGELAKGRE
jgi:DNA-binding transcriptional MerR regulator